MNFLTDEPKESQRLTLLLFDIKSIKTMSKIGKIALLLIFTLLTNQSSTPSHFEFVSKFAFDRDTSLNRTFIHLGQKITQIGNVTYSASSDTRYTIFNAKPTFFYHDRQQYATILGSDSLVISGGRVEANITFNWTKTSKDTYHGTGSCSGVSEDIPYAVYIEIQRDFSYSLTMLDYVDVAWDRYDDEAFKLTRLNPGASQEDKKVLIMMLNKIVDQKSIRTLIEEELAKIYGSYLKNQINDPQINRGSQFNYIWQPRKDMPNITIPMLRRTIALDVDKDGIQMLYLTKAENASDWRQGDRQVPPIPFDPRIYGALQQSVSFDFYENMLRFAIGKRYLDSQLNREYWGSSAFQFYAGDLYTVIPKLKVVKGKCTHFGQNIAVYRSTYYGIFNLSIQGQKIQQFSVNLTLEVEGRPEGKFYQFKLVKYDHVTSFYPVKEFVVNDTNLADSMVQQSLERLREVNLFGSGYPASPLKIDPHILTQDNYTAIYDSALIPEYTEAKNPQGRKTTMLTLNSQ